MVLTPIPHVFESVAFKPNKDDVEARKKQYKASLDMLRTAPGMITLPFEGIVLEDNEVTIRTVEWETREAHAKFRESELCAKYEAFRKGVIKEMVDVKHWHFFSSLPLDPMPGVIEYVTISLKPDANFEDFYNDWSVAVKGVTKTPGCGGVSIGRQIEDPTKVLQILSWMTLDDHMVGFKKAPDVKETMAALYVVGDKYIGDWKANLKGCHLMTCEPGFGI